MKYEFPEGCMQEGNPWFIESDYLCSSYGGGKPCRHCGASQIVTHTRADKSTYSETTWIVPRAVIAENEGGNNSTVVCLDCILDAAKGLDK